MRRRDWRRLGGAGRLALAACASLLLAFAGLSALACAADEIATSLAAQAAHHPTPGHDAGQHHHERCPMCQAPAVAPPRPVSTSPAPRERHCEGPELASLPGKNPSPSRADRPRGPPASRPA